MFLCLSLSSEPWARCRAGKKMTSTMHLDNHDRFLLAKIKYGCSTWIVNEKDKTVEHLLILLEVRFIFSPVFSSLRGLMPFPETAFYYHGSLKSPLWLMEVLDFPGKEVDFWKKKKVSVIIMSLLVSLFFFFLQQHFNPVLEKFGRSLRHQRYWNSCLFFLIFCFGLSFVCLCFSLSFYLFI